MNTKTFLFVAGIGITVAVASYVIIQWLKTNEQNQNFARQTGEPHKEMGFHALWNDYPSCYSEPLSPTA
jgi:hypothetical protein